MGRIFIFVMILMGFVSLGVFGWVALMDGGEEIVTPPPGILVDIGGYNLHIHCIGEKKRPSDPTIVMIAGGMGYSVSWHTLPSALTKYGRVCTYDRAGLGWSELPPKDRERSLTTMTAELHTLLRNAKEDGPYLLVGASWGATIAVKFNHEYGRELWPVGVLIDPVVPEMAPSRFAQSHPIVPKVFDKMLAQLAVMPFTCDAGLLKLQNINPASKQMDADTREIIRRFFNNCNQQRIIHAETAIFEQTLIEMDAALQDELPFASYHILQSEGGFPSNYGSYFGADFPVEEYNHVTWGGQRRLLTFFGEQSTLAQIPDTSHAIHLDAPQAVIDAVALAMQH